MQLIHVLNAKAKPKGCFSINPLNNLKLVGAVAVSANFNVFGYLQPCIGQYFPFRFL